MVSFIGFLIVVLLIVLATPPYVQAQGNAAESANAMCDPAKVYTLPCGQPEIIGITPTGRIGGMACPCQATVNGQPSTGICIQALKCEAKSSGGSGVDSMLSQLGQMLSQALSKLGQGGGGGGSGQQPQMPQTGSGSIPCGSSSGGLVGGAQGTADPCSSGCTTYYQVSTPSSDPCAYYVPNVANELNNTANDLLNSLNTSGNAINTASNPGTTSTTTGGSNSGGITNSQTTAAERANSILGLILNPASLFLGSTTRTVVNPDGTISTTTAYSFFGQGSGSSVPGLGDFSSFANIANIISGGGGDLQVGSDGVTITSSSRDPNTNTAVSGFFGASTVGGVGSQGIAAWLCRTRPWASSIFSKLVSSSYFDSLCTKRGYQVGGAVPKAVAPTLTQTPVSKKPAATTKPTAQIATSTGPAVAPLVQVWAVPAIVSIGSRTSVFWSARGVESCIVTSPDGSFHQTSLAGGASTVPLTAATTYTISCLTPDGFPATSYFTVKMAI